MTLRGCYHVSKVKWKRRVAVENTHREVEVFVTKVGSSGLCIQLKATS